MHMGSSSPPPTSLKVSATSHNTWTLVLPQSEAQQASTRMSNAIWSPYTDDYIWSASSHLEIGPITPILQVRKWRLTGLEVPKVTATD